MNVNNLIKRVLLALCLTAFIYTPTAIASDKGGSTMIHPGIMHSKESIKTMSKIVKKADKNDPAYAAYLAFKDDFRAQSDYQMKGPLDYVERAFQPTANANIFRPDFESAYMNAILWSVTGDQAHAKKSIEILEAYADKLERIAAHNVAPLLAGIQGFHIAAALEMLVHTYDQMDDKVTAKVNKMLREVFLPVLEEFYVTPAYTNGNWGLCVNRAYMALAVLWDDQQMYDRAVDFHFNGNDNGTLPNYLDSETGQCQESGRDQAHVQFGIACVASICEIAYNQGDDLYSALDNTLLKGYEYTAKYLCGYEDLPFKVWQDATVAKKYCNWTKISDDKREQYRPMWSIAYNHYVNRRGMEMPYTKEFLEKNNYNGEYDTDGIWYDVFQFANAKRVK